VAQLRTANRPCIDWLHEGRVEKWSLRVGKISLHARHANGAGLQLHLGAKDVDCPSLLTSWDEFVVALVVIGVAVPAAHGNVVVELDLRNLREVSKDLERAHGGWRLGQFFFRS